MVGTGAAAVSDAVALTRHAADLGFAGALVLPPFYYKGVPDDGLVAYVDALVKATAEKPIPIYLYHFPAMSGTALARGADQAPAAKLPVPHRRLEGFLRRHGLRALGRGGLKRFRRVPLDRSLPHGGRAAAISPAASRPPPISMPICARAPGAKGDAAALEAAVAIRKLFDGRPLVSGVKALLAHIHGDPALARVQAAARRLFRRRSGRGDRRRHDAIRAKRVAVTRLFPALTPAMRLLL